IITISIILMSFTFYGQEEFPRFEQDSLGNKYIAISMEQARYIDNKLDILKLLQDNDMLQFGLDSLNVQVVTDLETVIAKQSIQIKNLRQLVDNKDEQIFITPKGHFGTGYGEVDGNELTVYCNQKGKYNVLIIGTRKDEKAKKHWKGDEVHYIEYGDLDLAHELNEDFNNDNLDEPEP
ncbi:MAG: hypothetical protein ACOCRO_01960, partial [Halanaerobiales bacterium]